MQSLSFDGASWFAVHVRTNYERKICDVLLAKQVETFLPVYTVRRRWSDREKQLQLPLFPGYLFCRCVYDSTPVIVTTPGVVRFVGVGAVPSRIPDVEIEAIQRAVSSGLFLTPTPFLKIGQIITLCDGPLKGIRGILTSIRDQFQLVVSIELLQRSVSVLVDRSWVAPLSPSEYSLVVV